MKTKVILLTGLCALFSGVAAAQEVGDMKPGLWEVRALTMIEDGQDMMPLAMKAAQERMEHIAQMSPENRKELEASLEVQGRDPSGDQTVRHHCVSPEMAKNASFFLIQRPAEVDCSPSKINKDGNRTMFDISCPLAGMQGTIHSKGETVMASEQGRGKIEVVMTKNGVRHTMQAEVEMKFLASDCRSLEPLDQRMKK
ncbi:MAG: DUF3617 domain-containing protein [Azonexus sp.]|nr:DUF3617 domain-containing protein [Azonexus sp.]